VHWIIYVERRAREMGVAINQIGEIHLFSSGHVPHETGHESLTGAPPHKKSQPNEAMIDSQVYGVTLASSSSHLILKQFAPLD